MGPRKGNPGDTIPKILYGRGTYQTDTKVGRVKIHDISTETGIESIHVDEHSVFLIQSDNASTDVWMGSRLPQAEHPAGKCIFLPACTDVSSPYVSNPYRETMVRVPVEMFRQAARSVIDYDRVPMRFFGSQDPRLVGVTRALVAAAGAAEPFPLLVDSLATSLAIAVMGILSPQAARESQAQRGGFDGARRKRVLDYIHEHLSEPMTLAEVADVAAMSMHHFLRSFKAAMGRTPGRYILETRVEAACRMLATTTIPLAEVALACGFGTQSHFTTAFKEIVGKTPSLYRRDTS